MAFRQEANDQNRRFTQVSKVKVVGMYSALLACALFPYARRCLAQPTVSQPPITSHAVPLLMIDGRQFRDLNRNGRLDPFEDWRLSPESRAADLLLHLSLEEKAGLMMQEAVPAFGPGMGFGKQYDLQAAAKLVSTKKVNAFLSRVAADPESLAIQNNALQDMAENTPFAIPITLSTDPRNSFTSLTGASMDAGSFSQWPDMTGFGALRDSALTRRYADILRQEYLAVGFREALSPQADLATEPRWSRINGTFGEDPAVAKAMVEAYVAGFQNGEQGLNRGSVMSIAKHWVGYGAMRDGLDSHNSYSRHAVFPGRAFAQHLIPFEGVFAAKAAGILTTYAILDDVTVDGKPLQPVAATFNKQLLTDLLRTKYHFDGIVLSDFMSTADCKSECVTGVPPGTTPTLKDIGGMPWGVESLTVSERYAKAIDAGLDQFGGARDTEIIVALVRGGRITESRVDESAKRILTQKFALGLFESPYVDAPHASAIVGNAEFRRVALDTQERSAVLLYNRKQILPIRGPRRKVYLAGVDSAAATKAGLIPVATPAEADFALMRMHAPWQKLHPTYFFGSLQHEGDLDFKTGDAKLVEFENLASRLPVVVSIYLDRPAILSPLFPSAAAVLVNFGASDEALLALVTGKARPEGKLPFELPSSMNAVRNQKSDLPHDSAAPLFPIGFGLRFSAK